VATASVLAPAIALLALRERPPRLLVAALVVAALGIYLVTAPSTGGLNRGDLWTAVTALCFGVQIVAVAAFSRRYDPRRLVWLEVAGTCIGAAAAAAIAERPRLVWDPGFATALAYASLLATALALLWQLEAQRRMSAARAALIFCLEPVFAAAGSRIWFGERLSLVQWGGGGLIVLGMVLADRGRPVETLSHGRDI